MSDRITVGNNSTVINKSQVTNSFKATKDCSNDMASALALIENEIQNSGNEAVKVVFEKLKQELGNENPDKRAIKQCWDGVLALLPNIANLSESVAKITSLF